jgi:hypothetical protein
MAEKVSERARFTELRARALTNALLSGRDDLAVQEVGTADYGIGYLVTVISEKPGVRQFGVALRAAHTPVSAETANKVLLPSLQSLARYEAFPYPVVLFYFTMMDSGAWYTWVFGPTDREDESVALEMQQSPNCRPLDQGAITDIIERVHHWYDFSFSQSTKGAPRSARPQHKSGTKPMKNKVVITEMDSIVFDYSEELMRTREQLAAAQQCSNHIAKTYPTPLRTVTGFWDRQEDEQKRAMITLKVTDTVTHKSTTLRFTPKEIQNSAYVYDHFHRQIGELLAG